ncbi:MAG: phosphoglucosamine mutase [Phycisphaerae bacterium]|nr:phosphoglucosamine mutase [Phycisphaerae bacterium]
MTLIISVSGLRGIVGEGLTPQVACDYGCAFGTYLEGKRVVLARDTRPSGPTVSGAVKAGLAACGCDVLDLGVVSTPGAALMIRRLDANGGVVVTASHNPSEWNGIKLLSGQGWAFPPEIANEIRGIFESKSFRLVGALYMGRASDQGGTHEQHVEAVLSHVDADRMCRSGFKVVLDSINGAGGEGGARLLQALGCELIHVNAEPNGRFAHTPEPTAENLKGLCEIVREHGAQIGFAQDPDADRLAMVDENGVYIGEEYTLALAARQVLASRPGPVAANLSTSRMIDEVARSAGNQTVYRTPVGEAHVARAVLENGCVIGGEGNGGVIDPRVVPVRDSFVAMGLVLDLMAATGKSLSQLVAEIPRFTMIKEKFPCSQEKIAAVLEAVRGELADQRLNESDGIRIDWPEGWVHVRGSNTEPIMRIIGEATDQAEAEELIRRVRGIAERVLGS